MTNTETYIFDPKLIYRVKQYLQSKGDAFVHIDGVVQHLKAVYKRDYFRKKTNPFVSSVYKAMTIACQELNRPLPLPWNNSRDDSSSDSDLQQLVSYKDKNLMNIAMRKRYQSRTGYQGSSSPEMCSKLKKLNSTNADLNASGVLLDSAKQRNDRVGDLRHRERLSTNPIDDHDHLGIGGRLCANPINRHGNMKNGASSCMDYTECRMKKKQPVDVVYSPEVPATALRQHDSLDSRLRNGILTKSPESTQCQPYLDCTGADLYSQMEYHTGSCLYAQKDSVDAPVVQPFDSAAQEKMFFDSQVQLARMEEKLKSQAEIFSLQMKVRKTPTGAKRRNRSLSDQCKDGLDILEHSEVSATKNKKHVEKSNLPSENHLFEKVSFFDSHEIPNVSFSDVGVNESLKTELHNRYFLPFIAMRLWREHAPDSCCSNPRILLHAPSGSGKRFLAKAIASKLQVPFLNPNLHMLVTGVSGDSERRIRDLFEQALSYSPCVLFLEDIHSVALRNEMHSSTQMNSRMVSQLCQCLDEPWKGCEISLSEGERQLLNLTESDFLESLSTITPAAKREGFPTVPLITWQDTGALGHVRKQLEQSIMPWVDDQENALKAGLSASSGILLFGPPGCGKTMVAKAMANQAGLNFIHVNGPEILNKFVGESERGLRVVFERAQACAPCLIFFDEIDSICGNRQQHEGSAVNRNVTTQLLTLLDGCGGREQVFVMGATNVKECIDPALLRPGRFGDLFFIGLPDNKGRLDILKARTRVKPKLESDSILAYLADHTEGFSGADLNSLVQLAISLNYHNEGYANSEITLSVFKRALALTSPSVSRQDMAKYLDK